MSDRKSASLPEGFRLWGEGGEDPFEDMIGPFYLKPEGDGTYRSAFVAEPRHANMGGALHGGLLMSFADFALFSIARDHMGGQSGVTVSFHGDFVSAGRVGDLIEATGVVTKATGSMIFVQGRIFSGDTIIMPFSGIIKKLRRRD
jgi:acyl-coenzyme A thioesterase PaaI-like protein